MKQELKIRYERRDIYIVKDREEGDILKIFSIERDAEEYALRHGNAIIDQWPVEFEVKK